MELTEKITYVYFICIQGYESKLLSCNFLCSILSYTMDKNAIIANFTKYAHTYSKHAYVQRDIADELVKYVKECIESPASIVDIGTGTGTLLPFIRREYPYAQLYCNDISQAMLDCVDKAMYGVKECICGDAEKENLPLASLYISNFAFQWFQSLYESISRLYARCSTLAFTTLLEHTFTQWNELCHLYSIEPSTYLYPSYTSLHSYISQLPHRRFVCRESYYLLSFPNPRSFMRYIRGLGACAPSKKAVQNYKGIYAIEKPFHTYYHIAFVIITKE